MSFGYNMNKHFSKIRYIEMYLIELFIYILYFFTIISNYYSLIACYVYKLFVHYLVKFDCMHVIFTLNQVFALINVYTYILH
jgi:hypothetical protein